MSLAIQSTNGINNATVGFTGTSDKNIDAKNIVTSDNLKTVGGASLVGSGDVGLKMTGGYNNYIIDGRFDFWYEGTSQTSSGYGSDTMWSNIHSGSTKTVSQQAFAVGSVFPDGTLCPAYYSRTVVTSVAGTGNYIYKTQVIEDVTRLAGKTVTLSFYAKADTNKNIAIEFSQTFGTGGSPSASINGIGSQLVALTTAWQKFSITVTLPSISGKTLGTTANTSGTYLGIWMEAGSTYNSRTASLGQQSGTFDIANVALVEGTVPFDGNFLAPAVEELRVMRYYEAGNMRLRSYIASTNNAVAYSKFTSIKRTVPTMTFVNAGGTATPSVNIVFTDGASVLINGSGYVDFFYSFKADARL